MGSEFAKECIYTGHTAILSGVNTERIWMKRNRKSLKPFHRISDDLEFLKGFKAKPRLFLSTFLFNPGFRALTIYRIKQFLTDRGNYRLGLLFSNFNFFLSGIEICVGANISSPCVIRHPAGTVIGGGVSVGKRAIILHGVTLGQLKMTNVSEHLYPILGNDVQIGANSSILGGVIVANGTTLGAHSLLLNSTIENATYVGIPAKIVRSEKNNE